MTTADMRRARLKQVTEDDEQEEEEDDGEDKEREAQQVRASRGKDIDSLKKTRSVCMCIHHVRMCMC